VLVVAEAMHHTAAADVADLTAALADELQAVWALTPRTALLTATDPTFTFG
jgi:hypothetical protein